MKLTKALPTSVATVRNEFDRLFDQLRSTGVFGPAPRVFETMWSPSTDFSENEKEFIVRLEAPGVPKEDFEVNLEGQTLTISGRTGTSAMRLNARNPSMVFSFGLTGNTS